MGSSFGSPTLIGTATERKLFLLGLRYGRILGGSRNVAYEYTADVIPVAFVFQPDFARRINRHDDAAVYGTGVSPVGFRFIFNRRGRVKPFAGLSGGFLYTHRPVPVDVAGATRFNFTFDFGGGVQVFTRQRWAITIGYNFHHLSNANRSRVNPGLDSNVIHAGFSFFK
ncbi:MAG: acyloxyacyl hydrolase [Blastocatellia bacterium]